MSAKPYINDSGYWAVEIDGRERYIHRLIMEKELGRPLRKTKEVHHQNGNKTDNRISNLQVVTKTAHKTLHLAYRDRKKGGKKYRIMHCPVCGEEFARTISSLKTNKNPKCSRACANKYRAK